MKNNKQKKQEFEQKGFTMTEVLVYIGILSVIILIISSFVLWSIQSNTKARIIRETLDSARRTMDMITKETREAKSVYSPTTTSSQLSLETKRNLPQGEESSFVDFFICDTQLCLKKESQDPIAITAKNVEVSSLSFTKVGTAPSSVQIDLTLNYKNPQNRTEYNFSTNLTSTVSLRSY